MTTTNFAYTGSSQSYTVPAGVSVLSIDMCGGASERKVGHDALGYGDRVTFNLAVTPGDVITIWVGQDGVRWSGFLWGGAGANGYSGGGGGGKSSGSVYGPGAGGSSAILRSGTLLAEAAGGSASATGGSTLVAGAGGGGGYYGEPGGAGASGGIPPGGGGGGSQGGNGGNGANSGGAGGTGVNTTTHAGGVGSNTGPAYAGGTAYSNTGGHSFGFGNGTSYVIATGTTSVGYTSRSNTGYVSITAPAPLTPTLIQPAPSTVDIPDATFQWTYAPSLPGNTMTGYVLRYMTVGASAYSYYDAAAGWGSPSSTPVVNSGTSPFATPTSGTFPAGNRYQWSVANVDQGGQSLFPPDAVWTSANAPTVTITAPSSGSFNGAATVVTWTATAGSAPLSSVECQVLSDAQMTAADGVPFAGFPTTADSGVGPGTATTYGTPSVFQNGVLYWFCVKVTDTNGLATIAVFSSTCQFDGPALPRVFAVPTVDGVGTPCMQVTVFPIDNLLSASDSSFEATIGTWVATALLGLAMESVVVKDGLVALKLTGSGSGTQTAQTASGTGGYAVFPSQMYTATASFSANATARTASVGIAWYDAGGTIIGSIVYGTGVTEGTGGAWTVGSVNAIAPTNAAFAAVCIKYASGGATDTHYLDCVGLFTGTDLGAYTKSGSSVIVNVPAFTPEDVGCTFGGTNLAGGTTCTPTVITAFVNAYEVTLSSPATASGAFGFIGPSTGGSAGPPLWTIGGLTAIGMAVQADDVTTGQLHWVRFASPTNPFAYSGPSGMVLFDYEVAPGDVIDYTAVAIASNNGVTVSTPGNANPAPPLVTDRVWIFDPLQVGLYEDVVDVTLVSGSFSRGEYVFPHKQIGNHYLSIVSDTVGGIDASLTVRVVGAARWRALVGSGAADDPGLASLQETVCISDPLGGLYYGRLGIAPGGTSGGNASPIFSGAYIQANQANQVRDVSLTFVAQPAPAT